MLAKYKADDKSVAARYARAIAYYRIPQLKKALAAHRRARSRTSRNNPYFQELKGQMLFENGRVKEAIVPYQRAVSSSPTARSSRSSWRRSSSRPRTRALVPKALTLLNAAALFESDNPDLWRFLAIAYGRSGNMGMMALSLAEQGMADGNWKRCPPAGRHAPCKLLPPGPQRQRAQDIADDATRSRRSRMS